MNTVSPSSSAIENNNNNNNNNSSLNTDYLNEIQKQPNAKVHSSNHNNHFNTLENVQPCLNASIKRRTSRSFSNESSRSLDSSSKSKNNHQQLNKSIKHFQSNQSHSSSESNVSTPQSPNSRSNRSRSQSLRSLSHSPNLSSASSISEQMNCLDKNRHHSQSKSKKLLLYNQSSMSPKYSITKNYMNQKSEENLNFKLKTNIRSERLNSHYELTKNSSMHQRSDSRSPSPDETGHYHNNYSQYHQRQLYQTKAKENKPKNNYCYNDRSNSISPARSPSYENSNRYIKTNGNSPPKSYTRSSKNYSYYSEEESNKEEERFRSDNYISLCLRNLNEKIKVDEMKECIYDEFKEFGKFTVQIAHVDTYNNGETERIAFVNFNQHSEAKLAKRANMNKVIFGYPLYIESVKPKPKPKPILQLEVIRPKSPSPFYVKHSDIYKSKSDLKFKQQGFDKSHNIQYEDHNSNHLNQIHHNSKYYSSQASSNSQRHSFDEVNNHTSSKHIKETCVPSKNHYIVDNNNNNNNSNNNMSPYVSISSKKSFTSSRSNSPDSIYNQQKLKNHPKINQNLTIHNSSKYHKSSKSPNRISSTNQQYSNEFYNELKEKRSKNSDTRETIKMRNQSPEMNSINNNNHRRIEKRKERKSGSRSRSSSVNRSSKHKSSSSTLTALQIFKNQQQQQHHHQHHTPTTPSPPPIRQSEKSSKKKSQIISDYIGNTKVDDYRESSIDKYKEERSNSKITHKREGEHIKTSTSSRRRSQLEEKRKSRSKSKDSDDESNQKKISNKQKPSEYQNEIVSEILNESFQKNGKKDDVINCLNTLSQKQQTNGNSEKNSDSENVSSSSLIKGDYLKQNETSTTRQLESTREKSPAKRQKITHNHSDQFNKNENCEKTIKNTSKLINRGESRSESCTNNPISNERFESIEKLTTNSRDDKCNSIPASQNSHSSSHYYRQISKSPPTSKLIEDNNRSPSPTYHKNKRPSSLSSIKSRSRSCSSSSYDNNFKTKKPSESNKSARQHQNQSSQNNNNNQNVNSSSGSLHGGVSHYFDNDEKDATRTLFIGNLENDVEKSYLKMLFERYGHVEEIDIKTTSHQVPSSQSSHSQKRSNSNNQMRKTYAFVRYENMDMAIKAKHKMNFKLIGKNEIKIGYGKIQTSKCLWIAGLTRNTRKKDLHQELKYFASFVTQNKETLNSIEIDWEDGRYCCYVLCPSIRIAEEIRFQLKGKCLSNSASEKLRIDFTDQKHFKKAYNYIQSSKSFLKPLSPSPQKQEQDFHQQHNNLSSNLATRESSTSFLIRNKKPFENSPSNSPTHLSNNQNRKLSPQHHSTSNLPKSKSPLNNIGSKLKNDHVNSPSSQPDCNIINPPPAQIRIVKTRRTDLEEGEEDDDEYEEIYLNNEIVANKLNEDYHKNNKRSKQEDENTKPETKIIESYGEDSLERMKNFNKLENFTITTNNNTRRIDFQGKVNIQQQQQQQHPSYSKSNSTNLMDASDNNIDSKSIKTHQDTIIELENSNGETNGASNTKDATTIISDAVNSNSEYNFNDSTKTNQKEIVSSKCENENKKELEKYAAQAKDLSISVDATDKVKSIEDDILKIEKSVNKLDENLLSQIQPLQTTVTTGSSKKSQKHLKLINQLSTETPINSSSSPNSNITNQNKIEEKASDLYLESSLTSTSPIDPFKAILPNDVETLKKVKNISDINELGREIDWSGLFILKKNTFPTKFYLLAGNTDFKDTIFKQMQITQLHINQRLRVSKLDDIEKKLQDACLSASISPMSYAVYISLPNPNMTDASIPSNRAQQNLQNLISYLDQKCAAGVIPWPEEEKSILTLHLLTPCTNFSSRLIKRLLPSLSLNNSVSPNISNDFLMIVLLKSS